MEVDIGMRLQSFITVLVNTVIVENYFNSRTFRITGENTRLQKVKEIDPGLGSRYLANDAPRFDIETAKEVHCSIAAIGALVRPNNFALPADIADYA